MSPLSLFELNRLVRDALVLTLPEAVWVMAELSEIRQASNGHYYVEFVEKDESAGGGRFLAKARGNIWHTTAATIIPKFFNTTGQHLQAGMKLLVEVRPTFHEVYGYTLTILDIDPTYTLGEVARRRQEILHQLEDDGVLTLNKELPLPRPLMRIAVISAAGAAGYGDFVHQLEQSGFLFHTRLFPATMQGSNVEMSIIAALNAIAAEHEQWDCVTILRGGGASSDLNGFETYLLAANVAHRTRARRHSHRLCGTHSLQDANGCCGFPHREDARRDEGVRDPYDTPHHRNPSLLAAASICFRSHGPSLRAGRRSFRGVST